MVKSGWLAREDAQNVAWSFSYPPHAFTHCMASVVLTGVPHLLWTSPLSRCRA